MKSKSPFAEEARTARKYRQMNLPHDLLDDLIERELAAGRPAREAEKAARQKLHNIVAPYLGDPDYELARQQLDEAAAQETEAVQTVCTRLLAAHASTRERIPVLREVYQRIFSITGLPERILDLACGLNPFSLPWMDLPRRTDYHAYDIHQPRLALINHFFTLLGRPALAEQGDILLHPPQQPAGVAFFFKEAHRFEQRRRGCNRQFWRALRVHWLVVSLPAEDLAGHHSMVLRHRRLVEDTIHPESWPVTEFKVGNELFFCIEKNDEA